VVATNRLGYLGAMSMPLFRPHGAAGAISPHGAVSELTCAELAKLLRRLDGDDATEQPTEPPPIAATITWPVADDLAGQLAESLPLDAGPSHDAPPPPESESKSAAEDREKPPSQRDLALAALLADPPPHDDDATLDLLYTCWPRQTLGATDPDLLAVASNLARCFGRPGKTPMAAARAWRMLDPGTFEAEFSALLETIVGAIDDWQAHQSEFLILDFGEIDLIEILFEGLHPGRHQHVLASVMSIKALSHRRLGLLRRVPARLRRLLEPLVEAGQREAALEELAHAKELMRRVADPLGFAPIIETAERTAQELDKLARQVAGESAPPAATPPLAASLPLGRIGG